MPTTALGLHLRLRYGAGAAAPATTAVATTVDAVDARVLVALAGEMAIYARTRDASAEARYLGRKVKKDVVRLEEGHGHLAILVC